MDVRVITVGVLAALCATAQSVAVVEGNVVFTDQRGQSRQIAASHLDSDPSLSFDEREVVFVRRTPNRKIGTGLGDVDGNELWITSLAAGGEPRRVLAGRPGELDPKKQLVLAGFSWPQFSPDGGRIYFASTTWASVTAFHVLDRKTGRTRYLFAGTYMEVLRFGKYKGFLVGARYPEALDPNGRIDEYWLFDPQGKAIRHIGDAFDDIAAFKNAAQ